MNNKVKGCLIFLLLLFITIGAVNATDVSDDDTVSVVDTVPTTSTSTIEDITPDEYDNTIVDNSIIVKDTDKTVKQSPGNGTSSNPETHTTLTDGTTYSNAIITLNDDERFTDATVTFNDNVTL